MKPLPVQSYGSQPLAKGLSLVELRRNHYLALWIHEAPFSERSHRSEALSKILDGIKIRLDGKSALRIYEAGLAVETAICRRTSAGTRESRRWGTFTVAIIRCSLAINIENCPGEAPAK